jgi:hypothetical protein
MNFYGDIFHFRIVFYLPRGRRGALPVEMDSLTASSWTANLEITVI